MKHAIRLKESDLKRLVVKSVKGLLTVNEIFTKN